MTKRENYFKAVNFDSPDFIPMTFVINGACFNHYDNEQLFDLIESHPFLFEGFVRPAKGERFIPNIHPVALKNKPFTDDFGCVWTTTEDGITGTVIDHPIKSLNDYKSYKLPDPSKCMGIGTIDWTEVSNEVKELKSKGELTFGGLRHGHTFLQLCDIRGYENLMYDMIDEEPMLFDLIEKLEQFNLYIVNKYVEMGVDQISYAEDLGMQNGPMITRELFQKYIKPSYKKLMKPTVDKGILVHMHSDGDIKELADDLVDSGVQIINLQDLVNGIDWISNKYRGKICIDIDIDRQRITPYGSPSNIDSLIREEVLKLSTKQGGLTMIYGLYPGVPIENVKAIMDAMEKYAFYYR